MTDAPINNDLLRGYYYIGDANLGYYQKHTKTTLNDIAITPITPLLDVRPCNHITINTKLDSGLVELSLRVVLDEEFNADAQWHNYLNQRIGADASMFDNAIKLETHKLGISYLRLDAHKISSGTAIIDTWYRGLMDHAGKTAALTGPDNG